MSPKWYCSLTPVLRKTQKYLKIVGKLLKIKSDIYLQKYFILTNITTNDQLKNLLKFGFQKCPDIALYLKPLKCVRNATENQGGCRLFLPITSLGKQR